MTTPPEADVSALPDTVFLRRIAIVLLASTCVVGAVLFKGIMDHVELRSIAEVNSYAPSIPDVSLRNISGIQALYTPVN
jgi:hypothetical protein